MTLALLGTSDARDLRSRQMRFVPTRANFAHPVASIETRTFARGDLLCTSLAADDCIVANMPLLSQEDARLKAPLTSYSSRYVVKSGANAGDIIWSEPQFAIGPTAYSPASFAQNIMDNGCYIASLTTIESAIIANQHISPTLRARTFANIGANSLLTGDAFINRLEWQYRRWADKLQPNLSDPTQPSSPDFLEFEEFAPDFPLGSVAFEDNPNPGASVRSAGIIADMRRGSNYLIMFQRYNVSPAPGGDAAHRHFALTYDSQHKVAVSGFQPGVYPLLINDVGNGQRYHVRLTTDVRTIPFTETRGGKTVTIPPRDIVLDPPTGGAPPTSYLMLIYEGADGVNVSAGGQIFLIEDVQSLTLGRLHPPPPPHCHGTQCQ
jgi:hypothetical protein